MREIETSKRGEELLRSPILNKGTAFSLEERSLLGLHGLLPPHVTTVDEQIARCRLNFDRKRTPLGRYVYLLELMNRNEHLFYQFVSRHASEMMPYIYTPTVGEGASHFNLYYANARGLYLSYPQEDRMDEMIANIDRKEVEVIVVTDGERILGLGDLGLGGIAIPIGKLALYVLFGGIPPAKTLPIVLDVGTNNKELLRDPMYLGWRHERVSGNDYDRFLERFVRAVRKRYPNVLLQWEDFGKGNAYRLLNRYRKELLSFNDDIQGTAAVALAGLLAAVKETGGELKNQKVVLLGGGSAGLGIAHMLVQTMVAQGVEEKKARSQIFVVDLAGLLHTNLTAFDEQQRPFLQAFEALRSWKLVNSSHISLLDVIKNVHPTVLIGVSGQGGAFTEELVKEMAKAVDRPIIFPLSNPTSKAEATPDELIRWSEGRAIVATGSPFVPVVYEGKTYTIGQCNNVYIFPGIGLGVLAAGAREVTDGMFRVASETLAAFSPALQEGTASLFPPFERVRDVSIEIARAVATQAEKEGVAPHRDIEKELTDRIWVPSYPKIVPKR
jgi:malate dehydrogenase (oxaloacetate-decarboxylating)